MHDPGTRGLDLIKIIMIEISENLENIRFFDGRINGGLNPLNRDFYALEIDQNLKWTGKIGADWRWNKKQIITTILCQILK